MLRNIKIECWALLFVVCLLLYFSYWFHYYVLINGNTNGKVCKSKATVIVYNISINRMITSPEFELFSIWSFWQSHGNWQRTVICWLQYEVAVTNYLLISNSSDNQIYWRHSDLDTTHFQHHWQQQTYNIFERLAIIVESNV